MHAQQNPNIDIFGFFSIFSFKDGLNIFQIFLNLLIIS